MSSVAQWRIKGKTYSKRSHGKTGLETEATVTMIHPPPRSTERCLDLTPEERHMRDLRNSEDSQRRAKKGIRQGVRAGDLRFMWTLTCRDNVQCRDEALKRWEQCRRRLDRYFKDLHWVRVMERQKRGAIHLHVAVSEYIPHQLFWRCWSPEGYQAKKEDGTGYDFVYVTGPRHGSTVTHCANYMVKYLSKEFGAGHGREGRQKRYDKSRGIMASVLDWKLEFNSYEEAVAHLYSVAGYDGYYWGDDDCRFVYANNFND